MHGNAVPYGGGFVFAKDTIVDAFGPGTWAESFFATSTPLPTAIALPTAFPAFPIVDSPTGFFLDGGSVVASFF